MVRHFLRDDDLSPAEQAEVLTLATQLKQDRTGTQPLAGPRVVAILFDKPTLRTQTSFSVGVAELGGYPMVVDGRLAQIGVRESVADTARVLSRQVAAIVWRTYGQDRINQMAAAANVPVINALTDDFHPCQALADLQTIREHRGELAGQTLSYLGDASNNMAHSYLLAGATAGMHVRVAGPEQYTPDPRVWSVATTIASETGGSVRHLTEAKPAVEGADAVATDTWVSMGQEDEAGERIDPFRAFAVSGELMAAAAPDAVFLHCLPAYRGYEVTAEVIDGPASVVWDEAENRLHTQKALVSWLLARTEGA